MREEQWEMLKSVVSGGTLDKPLAGFIIDSPWLPNWAGHDILDYFASEELWFEDNLRAIEAFPDALFLPGFWSEYGMCTEPSAFGARCIFYENEFPFAEKVIADGMDIPPLKQPNPETDGLAPFMLRRLTRLRPRIEAAGHAVRFAVARGPLNIAGFLMGNTELLMALRMLPDAVHGLLETVTGYLEAWLQLQARAVPTIDGILLLDDLVGFCGEDDFTAFGKPYLERCFAAIDSSVRCFHNDARGTVCAPHLADIGVNLFNFSHDHPIAAMREAVGDAVALLGNIPPRDVLASGTPGQVRDAVQEIIAATGGARRGVILSCGGGMPPGVPNENIAAFLEAVRGA